MLNDLGNAALTTILQLDKLWRDIASFFLSNLLTEGCNNVAMQVVESFTDFLCKCFHYTDNHRALITAVEKKLSWLYQTRRRLCYDTAENSEVTAI